MSKNVEDVVKQRFEDILTNFNNRKPSKYGVFYKNKLVNLNGGVAAYKSYNLARANIISLFSYEYDKEEFFKAIDKLIDDKIIEIRELV